LTSRDWPGSSLKVGFGWIGTEDEGEQGDEQGWPETWLTLTARLMKLRRGEENNHFLTFTWLAMRLLAVVQTPIPPSIVKIVSVRTNTVSIYVTNVIYPGWSLAVTTNLTKPTWIEITNLTPASGMVVITNIPATSASAFFRVQSF